MRAADATYRVYVWGMAMKGGNRVIERRRFKTERGARDFAARRSIDTGKATITIPTIDDPIGHPLAYYREGFEGHTPATTTTTEDTTMPTTKTTTEPLPTPPVAKKPAPKKATPIKTWDDALAASDGAISKAYADRKKKPLAVDVDAILKDARSTKPTARYDTAYVRFLAGMTGSVPSNPTSSGIAEADTRAKRRDAIRKALAKTTAAKAA